MARPTFSPLVIALVIAGVLACSVFIYFQIIKGVAETEPPVVPPPPVAPPPPPPEVDEALELPPLDESDDDFRLLVGTLSAHPQLAAWLAPEHLVRRFVAAVVDVANGESPRPHLGHLKPKGAFKVSELEGRLFVDRATFARYNLLTEVFTSLDNEAGVRLYGQMKPLFDQAYQDLGYPDGDFDVALDRAIERVLDIRVPTERMIVKRRVKNYRFASPELEGLPEVEKHLLRLGPSNARKVQDKLGAMRAELSLGG